MNKENEIKASIFLQKLEAEIVFFKNEFEDAAVKSIPGIGIFVKMRGGKEFKAKAGSKLVTDAYLEYTEITEKEYLDW